MADAEGNQQKFGLLPDVPIGEDIGPSTRTGGDALDRNAFVEVLGKAAIETPRRGAATGPVTSTGWPRRSKSSA